MSPLQADDILANTSHRPWEIPQQPWVMAQSWQKLLFAHWALPIEEVRLLIPAPLELDTFDGMAYIGVVPFFMNHVHMRSLPPIPTTHRFPELNVRTYVTHQGKAGVWFFSLDADSRLAVRVARLAFHLPYFDADMSITHRRHDWIQYDSRRTHRGSTSADFIARYRPTSDVFLSEVGSLDEWLTERYCLYSMDAQNNVYRGEIHHEKWQLQHAEADITVNTMGRASKLSFPDESPILHYVENIDVLTWLLTRF
jgi:uncharacterized protein